MNKLFLYIWEVSKIVIVALLIVVPIRYFIFQPFFVRGQSMEPNFYNSDYLIIDEHAGEAGFQTRLEAFIDTL